ncbi:DUF3817 domain-containing protein [Tumebacillus sp. ITR2]|uniref:DUF3817 domain-containing protein n=1 Tax=Tumebacillus amylolyticus TaxID=2801339 RepID=A0ABS1JB40_9BACL|nr:DUF3817 domain-containing protein [Tumebacillus amylolyticus]MBL0387507.1 DUF3817 domain-containing protein [Tumebacillus amylolyticus]
MLKSPIGRLRAIGIIEGLSFLVLLLIAMPLKYVAGKPEAVQIVGAVHGVLFVLYIGAVLLAAKARRWSFGRVVIALIVSSIPIGTFVFDKSLRREQHNLA